MGGRCLWSLSAWLTASGLWCAQPHHPAPMSVPISLSPGVRVQEAERMNALLVAMRRSLVELNLGLKGDLTMTEPMEKLTKALASDQVRSTAALAAWTLPRNV